MTTSPALRGCAFRVIVRLLVIGLVAASLVGTAKATGAIDFAFEVRPILSRHCFPCHGFDAQSRKAKLRLDTSDGATAHRDGGAAVVPGDPDASALFRLIRSSDPDERMPPADHDPLSPEEIATVERWIREGAEYSAHWSWRPLEAPAPPRATNEWCRDEVDGYVLDALRERKLAPAPEAIRATWLRRVTFDLTGLPPTPEELDAFTGDESPGAYERVVDRLLASPHYAERWARHWLDLMRYAETYGHEYDYPISHAHQYRDYVIRAFEADVPFDWLVTEHIAGDLLEEPRRHPETGRNESIIGTGFWLLHQGTHGPVDVLEDELERMDNQIDVLSKAFLATTVSCARCHDHKFDPIPTTDYYALAGFLQSSYQREVALYSAESSARIDQLAAAYERGRVAFGALTPEAIAERVERELLASLEESGPVDGASEAAPGGTERVTRWRDLLDGTLADPAHPLHIWHRVHDGPREEADVRARTLAEEEATRVTPNGDATTPSGDSESRLFESFDDFGGWSVSGKAFGPTPTRSGSWSSHPDRICPVTPELPGVADSGRYSARLRGSLRSPTFELDSTHIHYRVRGKGRVRVIVEGYTLDRFNSLLFVDLTHDIDTRGEWQWVDQVGDLHAHRGYRVAIEIIDDGDHAIAVDEIRFSDGGPRGPVVESPLASALAGVDSVESLAHAIGRAVGEAWSDWQSGALEPAGERLLGALAHHGALPLPPMLARIVDEMAGLERGIGRPTVVLAMGEATPEEQPVYVRGNPHQAAEVVPRRFLTAFDPDPTPIAHGSGRLELARRILAPKNPLPARVWVNRVWHHLFGRGLVPTPDDFGALGGRPSHPELLDALAVWMRDEGDWSTKALVRRLVLTSTYRMSSVPVDARASALRDPNRVYFSARRVRRLEGEAIRDAILAVSGRLDRTRFGRSVPMHLTPFLTGRGRPGKSGPLDGDGRRSVYLEVRRNFPNPLMSVFDAPVPMTCIGSRTRSNVPSQALTLLNDPFVRQQAAVWAERIVADGPAGSGSSADSDPSREARDRDRIEKLFRRALGRSAADDEIALCTAFLAEERAAHSSEAGEAEELAAWTEFAHALFNLKEFIFID